MHMVNSYAVLINITKCTKLSVFNTYLTVSIQYNEADAIHLASMAMVKVILANEEEHHLWLSKEKILPWG